MIWKLTSLNSLRITGVHLTAAAKLGNVNAEKIVRRAGTALGTAITSMLHVVNPSHVILCGHLAPVYYNYVKAVIQQRALPSARKVEIVVSEISDPALLGAASLVLDYSIRRIYGNSH